MSEGSGSRGGGYHQGWTVEELRRGMPGQSILRTNLPDGRRVTLESFHVGISTAGCFAGKLDRIWEAVIKSSRGSMTSAWGHRPTHIIPPVSLHPGLPVLPRWRVHALLKSEPFAPTGSRGPDGSELVIVFFCNDIAIEPITVLLGEHLVSMDECTWRKYARDFTF